MDEPNIARRQNFSYAISDYQKRQGTAYTDGNTGQCENTQLPKAGEVDGRAASQQPPREPTNHQSPRGSLKYEHGMNHVVSLGECRNACPGQGHECGEPKD